MLIYDRFAEDFKVDVIDDWLHQIGFLRSYFIFYFGKQMTAGYCVSHRDDVVFRCDIYWSKIFVRAGTIFPQFQSILRQIMMIIANGITKATVTLTAIFANVTEASVVQWYKYYRDICAVKTTSMHQSFGGTGRILEVDDTVIRKREFISGRSIEEDWVSSTTSNILSRSLVYVIDNYKSDTSSA